MKSVNLLFLITALFVFVNNVAASVEPIPAPTVTSCKEAFVSVDSPTNVVSGDLITFKAESLGKSSFRWSISAGKIVSGQGTSSITVDTNGVTNLDITATAASGGACGGVGSSTVPVNAKFLPTPYLIDKSSNKGLVFSQIDRAILQTTNNPGSNLIIVSSGKTEEEALDNVELVIDRIFLNDFDINRVEMKIDVREDAIDSLKLYSAFGNIDKYIGGGEETFSESPSILGSVYAKNNTLIIGATVRVYLLNGRNNKTEVQPAVITNGDGKYYKRVRLPGKYLVVACDEIPTCSKEITIKKRKQHAGDIYFTK